MDNRSKALLVSIIAHARSGALERAWRLFGEAGLDRVTDDPAVLSVKGRLLKDRALAASGEARRALYLEAAEAYASAGAIDAATYPLINAATLSLLAGRREQAEELARQVLEKNLRDAESETPYWRAATRAEALLLLGDTAQAKDDFREAIALAPLAYEDHASTLRQFGLILDAQGADKTWLDSCRPPRSLHFAGHMAIGSGGGATARAIRTLIKEEHVGFGYGALAAGADILIAEALLEAGAELHLVLPNAVAQFRAGSVAAYGENWAARFDDVQKSADTLRTLGQDGDPLSPLAIRLAAEVAMGGAVMQASLLMSEAVQLLVLERAVRAAKGASGAIGEIWAGSGRRQHILLAPRTRTAEAIHPDQETVCLAAALRIELSAKPGAKPSLQPLAKLATALASGPVAAVSPRWTGEAVLVAYDTPAHAAEAALAAAKAMNGHADFRIAGHFALAERIDDPFGPVPLLTGAAPDLAAEIALSTSAGAIHVSEDFAAALHAGPAAGRPRTELVGELPGGDIENPLRLFSLRR